jgi:hypothetical protein
MHAPALDESRRAQLEHDITMLELKYFGPGNEQTPSGELGEVLQRWASAVPG